MSTDYYLVCTECGHQCACLSRKMWGLFLNKSAMAAFVREHLYCEEMQFLSEEQVDHGDYINTWLKRDAEKEDYYDSEKDILDTPSLFYSDKPKHKGKFKTSFHKQMESIYLDHIKELKLKLEALKNIEDLRKQLSNNEDYIKRLNICLENKQLANHDASIFEAAIQEEVNRRLNNDQ